jgi:hypothetical protein
MYQRYRLQLLAPTQVKAGIPFSKFITDSHAYRKFLVGLQRLRGRLYLEDGAIKPSDLDLSGRFQMPGDEQAWHLLLVDENAEVIGCARYLLHPNTVEFHSLRISHCAQARDAIMGPKVREAVEADLELARRNDLSYVEIGGWALATAWRGTKAGLDILAASYALGDLWGGCLGVCTATARHGSASILRRMGGSSFHYDGNPIPAYEDPQYGCEMELLRFERAPAQRFAALIDPLRTRLAAIPAISAAPVRHIWGDVLAEDLTGEVA